MKFGTTSFTNEFDLIIVLCKFGAFGIKIYAWSYVTGDYQISQYFSILIVSCDKNGDFVELLNHI